MTETRDSELVRRLRGAVSVDRNDEGKIVSVGVGSLFPIADLLNEAADTIDRLTSAGEAETEDAWRDLALQFDGHRIEALSMLRYAERHINEYATVRDILREPLSEIRAFLAKPPLSGEAVLAARLAASPREGHVEVPPMTIPKQVSTGVKAVHLLFEIAKTKNLEHSQVASIIINKAHAFFWDNSMGDWFGGPSASNQGETKP